jgi:ubiquinone/menaquinone biosynthesis C-methylase UbiE
VGPKGHVTGIDLSGAILREAERAVQADGLTNVELRKMDAEHLGFPDQTFDVVTCAFAFFLFPDLEAAVREMYRVCKPGGYLAVTSFNKSPWPWDPGLMMLIKQFLEYRVGVQTPQPLAYAPQEVEALLSRFGFHSIETHNETNDIIFSSAEDWWEFLMTLLPRVTILGMDDETRARFRDEYLARMRPLCRPDGLHLSSAVIYSLAKR